MTDDHKGFITISRGELARLVRENTIYQKRMPEAQEYIVELHRQNVQLRKCIIELRKKLGIKPTDPVLIPPKKD